MMVIDNKYEIGEIVYLKTDQEQMRRIVVGLKIMPDNILGYGLACGVDVSYHYDFELTAEEDIAIKVK